MTRLDRRHAATAIVGAAAAAAVYGQRARGRRRERRRRHRFDPEQALDTEIRRVLDGQLDLAIAALGEANEDGIHEARKALKRLRALLRLVRDELGADRYGRLNTELRDAGRALSTARDATALARALETLAEEHADEVSAPELGRARERVRAMQARSDLADPVEATVRRLIAIRSELATLSIRGDLGPLLRGLRRSYRRGRRAARAAQEAPNTELLHEWRKRAKDLRYHAELLRDADPARLRAARAQARELSDLLGNDHDLALLGRVAADCPTLIALIATERRGLAARAFELGEALYARPPRRVVSRLRRRAARRTAW